MADVVYLARDMLFTSKIREVARQLGVTVESARDGEGLARAAAGARLVILDLRLPGALEALDQLNGQAPAQQVQPPEQTQPRKVVGFIDHERTDVMDEARARGCTEVLTKGQFSHSLPRLLAPPSSAAP